MTAARPGRRWAQEGPQEGADLDGISGRGKHGVRGQGELSLLLRVGIGDFSPKPKLPNLLAGGSGPLKTPTLPRGVCGCRWGCGGGDAGDAG